MSISTLSDYLQRTLGLDLWLITLLGLALLALVLNQVVRVALRHAARLAAKTSIIWDDALLHSVRQPLHALIWVVSAGFMARVVQGHLDADVLSTALPLRDVGVVGCVMWFAWQFIGRVSLAIAQAQTKLGQEVDRTTLDALSKLAKLVVLVVGVITTAQTLGFQIGGLLALGGVGGIAVGLAAKDLLANFFGGLTIYLDRPFAVGEWIRSPDKSIEGVVEYISWRHTRIRAFNKNPIYVPNAVFTSIVVENPSRMTHRRLQTTVGVRYDDFGVVPAIVADIRALLQNHPDIDTSETLIVNFNAFGPSSLDILIYTFTRTVVWTEFHTVKEAVLLEVGRIIERHGAQIAFPTQTLHLVGSDSAGQRAGSSKVMPPVA